MGQSNITIFILRSFIYEDDVIISDVCTFYMQIINLSVNIIKISRFTEYSYNILLIYMYVIYVIVDLIN